MHPCIDPLLHILRCLIQRITRSVPSQLQNKSVGHAAPATGVHIPMNATIMVGLGPSPALKMHARGASRMHATKLPSHWKDLHTPGRCLKYP